MDRIAVISLLALFSGCPEASLEAKRSADRVRFGR